MKDGMRRPCGISCPFMIPFSFRWWTFCNGKIESYERRRTRTRSNNNCSSRLVLWILANDLSKFLPKTLTTNRSVFEYLKFGRQDTLASMQIRSAVDQDRWNNCRSTTSRANYRRIQWTARYGTLFFPQWGWVTTTTLAWSRR
jgi:hypothetical protein